MKQRFSSRSARAAILVTCMTDSRVDHEARKGFARGLLDLKKTSKVSWETLAVTESMVKLAHTILAGEPKPPKASKKTKALSLALHSAH